MPEEKILVIGAGTMGHSIALSVALVNYSVTVLGIDEQDIKKGMDAFNKKLKLLIESNAISKKNYKKIKDSVTFCTSRKECLDKTTLIIEAIPENLRLKQQLFSELDRECNKNIILASTTSGLSPTDLARHTKYPERVIVTHFWNPAHLIPLVEVIRGEYTSDKTIERVFAVLEALKKKPILVKKDILGSIGNRLQYALFREAQYIYEQGAASIEDIDKVMMYSLGRRYSVTGPFLSADMGGLDVFDAISNYLFPDLCTATESLSKMKELVFKEKYGQKSYAGFYQWTDQMVDEINEKREAELIRWLKVDSE